MGFSIWHMIVVLLVVLIVFGAGKLPEIMGDFAKGIKAFKTGLKDDGVTGLPGQAAQAPDRAAKP
ncbi:MAG: twin-arginine translocase TatA/TatE family subunit [Azospirillum sp.]|nr:twin-arginine translocase TatA/TatE family subunit [Azospirillum sp.]